MTEKKFRYAFRDKGKEKVYQSETPYSASSHVVSQYKPSKEDSETAGHKNYTYSKKTGTVEAPHEREESGVKVSGYKYIPTTKEHEEELKNASINSDIEKGTVTPIRSKKTEEEKNKKAFRMDTKEVDTPKQYRQTTQFSGDEPSTHSVGFPKVGDNQSIRDKKYTYKPKEQKLVVEDKIGHYGKEPKEYDTAGPKRNIPELINASIDVACDDIMNKTKASKMSRAFQHYGAAEEKKKAKEEAEVHRVPRPSMLSGEIKNVSDKIVRVRPRKEESMSLSISDACDNILCKYMGTGRYSGSGANEPVVTKREGYTVRERPLPGQTKASIVAGHIAEQKKESPKKMEPEEKEKTKIREEGYKLGQKNPASQYASPAPPEKKYSGSWKEFFRRSEGNMDLKKSIDELLDRALLNKGKFADPKTGKPLEGSALYYKKYGEAGQKKTYPKHVSGTSEEEEYRPNKVRDISDSARSLKQEQYRTKKHGGTYVTEEDSPKVFRHKTRSEMHSEDITSDKTTDKAIARHGKKFQKESNKFWKERATMKSLNEQIGDLLIKCNSHVISGETEEGLKKKKKQAPKADGHTLGNTPLQKENEEMVKVDVEGAFKSLDERTADLHKAQLPGLNKPAVKQTEKVKTTEDVVRTEKPKNLIRSMIDDLIEKAKSRSAMGQYDESVVKKLKRQKGVDNPYALATAIKEGTVKHKSMDDLTVLNYVEKSAHLFKDIVKSEGKPVEFFHTPDETHKSQKTILNKWKSGNVFSISGNRILNTAKDMASEGYTSLKKEDEDVAKEEVAGRKRMDREDVKAEIKASRKEYSDGDEGAE